MTRMGLLGAVMLIVGAARLPASELVAVPGCGTQFTTTMNVTIADKPVHLLLTGVGLRQKFFFNVYAIASYVVEGAAVHSAEELAAINQPKQLHLVMLRDVSGSDIAEAFLVAIRQNHPAPEFTEEVNRLVEILRGIDFKKDDHVYLTHQPGIGLRCQVIGKGDFTIDNPEFSRAIWDIYLGANNVGEGIKKGLTSRLQ
jgi:hypothetical protein